MVKKVLRYCASIIAYTVILGLLAPILDMVNILDTYTQPIHWLTCFVAAFIVYNLHLYFVKINSRKMYYLAGIYLTVIVILSFSLAFVFAIIFIALIENIAIKIVLLIVSLLVYLFLIYVFVHRGVAIYDRGKIRIFKFLKIKTYKAEKIDCCKFDYVGKKCIIHITVSGDEHIFKMSSSSAKICEQRLKSIK